MKNHFAKRWSTERIEAGIAYIHGAANTKVFDRTPDGRVDLRGLPLTGVFRPDGVRLRHTDFGGMSAKKLIFANSRLEGCVFDGASLGWGSYASSFDTVSFLKCDFEGSSLGTAGTSYMHCNFSRADLSGISNLDTVMTECVFEDTVFEKAMFKRFSLVRCRILPVLKGALFGTGEGGSFHDCNFTTTSFIDCGFSRTQFESCQFSGNTLLFSQWPLAVSEFKRQIVDLRLPELLSACQRWLNVSHLRLPFTIHEIVDLEDLKWRYGPTIGRQMFDILAQIWKDVEPKCKAKTDDSR